MTAVAAFEPRAGRRA